MITHTETRKPAIDSECLNCGYGLNQHHPETGTCLQGGTMEDATGYEACAVDSTCSCGAHWSHPATRTQDEMASIFLSHVKYFENETVVL